MTAPVLFLGHAADRTGPPIYLLHFLRWLRVNQPEIDFEVVLLAGGELEADFAELAPTTVYRGLTATPWDDQERSMLLGWLDAEDEWWAMRRERQLRLMMADFASASTVYVSSAAAVELARYLPPADRTIVTHVHELEVGLDFRLSSVDREYLLDRSDRILVVADAVADNLQTAYGVDPDRLAHHSEMVQATDATRSDVAARLGPRAELGLPAEGSLVGSCGSIDWRKAVDVFCRVARLVRDRGRAEPVHFLWVGGDDVSVRRARRMADDLGVGDSITFVGNQPDPTSWFALMDVFVLPAREDPFPLVCLEALSVETPVVAFDTGGMPELLRQGCGLVAAYPDVYDFADKVEALLDDPAQRARLGARGAHLVAANHDVSVRAPALWDEIKRFMP